MDVEVGAIVEGKVSGITNFGVFVDIGETTGMVHISEVARNYVKDLKEFVKMGQEVKVKVISVSPEGKISLSMIQAEEPEKGKSAAIQEEKESPQRFPAEQILLNSIQDSRKAFPSKICSANSYRPATKS